ncbi:hypothetical protein Taro_011967, partial [Colocasia esculenta]|nr:hypothetical protein [Colocasia esculenta]
MYADNAHVDGEVLQDTLNVIGHLSMTPEKRLEAELQNSPMETKSTWREFMEISWPEGERPFDLPGA